MSEQLLIKTFTAQNDIAKNRFVAINSDKVQQGAAARGKVIGVTCSYNVKADERVDVGLIGIFDVEASLAISPGVAIGSARDGRALAHSSSTSDKAGIALTAAGSSGDLVRVLVLPQ